MLAQTTRTLPTGLHRPTGKPARRRRSRPRHRLCRTGAAEDAGTPARTLPIFPLGLVACPNATTDLHIFEARYRVLFATLLGKDADIEQGLCDENSPYAGTGEFGICYALDGNLRQVGVKMRVEGCEDLGEGRLNIRCRGVDRFVVKDVLKEVPFLIASVENYTDADAGAVDAELLLLAKEVSELTDNVVGITNKLRNAKFPTGPSLDDANERGDGSGAPTVTNTTDSSAEALSYRVAALFDEPQMVQAMLEMRSTTDRLERQRSVLKTALSRMAAKSAIASAFGSMGSGGESEASGGAAGSAE